MTPIAIGHIEAIFRYPVKSMRGEALETAELGWHGLAGDRRLALRRLGKRGGMPWLTASKLPELVLFTPERREDAGLPNHVVTPEGQSIPIFGEALATDVARRCGEPVEMTHLVNGIFDDGTISVITSDTIGEISRLAATRADSRRFRTNILVRSSRAIPFEEDEWLGGLMTFGEGDSAPAVAVTTRDVRCAMINIDPDDASVRPEMFKAVVSANGNNAGIYAAVTRAGRLSVGQPILLYPNLDARRM